MHSSCTADILSDYIASLGVDKEKLSCSEAKSKFGGSFHVSIDVKDCNIFCNPDNWPENVIVRDWVFKEKKSTILGKNIDPSNPSSDAMDMSHHSQDAPVSQTYETDTNNGGL